MEHCFHRSFSNREKKSEMPDSCLEIRCKVCGRVTQVTTALFRSWPISLNDKREGVAGRKRLLGGKLHRLKCLGCGVKGQAKLEEVRTDRPKQTVEPGGRGASTSAPGTTDRSLCTCERCTRRIRAARLRLRPNTRFCEECERLASEDLVGRGGQSRKCPRCGSRLVLRMPRGTKTEYFFGCSSFPQCRYTE
jgi:hypothetical protein